MFQHADQAEGWLTSLLERMMAKVTHERSYLSQETWRQAGISYLRYANICAQVVRRSLKEPLKAKAVQRDAANMKVQTFEGGKRTAVREYTFHQPVVENAFQPPDVASLFRRG